MKAHRTASFSSAILGLLVATVFVAPASLASADHKKPAHLRIEPVVCRSSEGKNPAPSRLDRKAIESVFAQANIQITWLPTRYLDDTASRDGIESWKKIAALGKKRGLWETGPTRLSLVFVNKINRMRVGSGLGAIDSRKDRPLKPGGPICLISQTEKPMPAAMEAYCVAHEIGHCLGLHHFGPRTPQHPKDKPSIMNGGGGKFSYQKRMALVPSQIDVVRKSKLLSWTSDESIEKGTNPKESHQQAADERKQGKEKPNAKNGHDPFAGLELTNDQLRKIKTIKANANKAKRKLWADAKSGAIGRKKFAEIKKGITTEFQASLKEVLSDEQYKEYQKSWQQFLNTKARNHRRSRPD